MVKKIKKIKRSTANAKKTKMVSNKKRANASKQMKKAVVKQSPKLKQAIKTIPAKKDLKKVATKPKEPVQRKKINVSIPQHEDAKLAIDRLLSNERAVEYLKKNVSKMAVDVVDMLSTPKTDEFLAEQLGMKINAIRRILNIMQGYGITNYYISKNTKGWLSFAWYINTSKLAPFLQYVDGMEREKSIVSEKCNDYFMCAVCYKTDRFLFTFDSAFENSFKCNSCGKNLDRMNREEVETLMSKQVTQEAKA